MCLHITPQVSVLAQARRNVFTTGPAKLDHEDYADNFMIKILKNHTPFCLLRSFPIQVPCKHNNKWNAWVSDNLAPPDMPFLSIIA